MFFAIWFVLFVLSNACAVKLYHHAVGIKEGYKRYLRSLFTPSAWDFETALALTFISATWMFLLPGILFWGFFGKRGLVAQPSGWVLVILANVPYWMLLDFIF